LENQFSVAAGIVPWITCFG